MSSYKFPYWKVCVSMACLSQGESVTNQSSRRVAMKSVDPTAGGQGVQCGGSGCRDARKKCLGLPPYSPAPVLMSSRCGERVSGLACRKVTRGGCAIQRDVWLPDSSHSVRDVLVPLRYVASSNFCPLSSQNVTRPSSTPSRYVFSLHFCVLAVATQTNAVITVVNASQTQNFISF